MSDDALLIAAMADKCLETIRAWKEPGQGQPAALQPTHLEWMCHQISRHARDWPATKVHRWIGFVQAALIANRMLDLAGAKRMFDDAKQAFGAMDEDLVDHLDPTSSFRVDLGGQG